MILLTVKNICTSFDDKDVVISNKYDKTNRKIPLGELTRFLVPMFAVTVHKSQGITLNSVYTIWQWNRMDRRSKYVE